METELKESLQSKVEYSLSLKTVIILFIYYICISIAGLVTSLYLLINSQNIISSKKLIIYTFFLSIASSSMLSSMYYIRKLYKACIMDLIKKGNGIIKEIGNTLYFVTRPLFSVVFSVVFIICMFGGMFIVTGNLDFFANTKFMYLSTIASCVIGFSTGDVINEFTKFSKEKIKNIRRGEK